MIDWTDHEAKASEHFTVGELIWLPTWTRLATEEDGLDDSVKGKLLTFAGMMDEVRHFLGLPIIVHCWYRPKIYNSLPTIKGARYSAHMCLGPCSAVDFHVKGFEGIEGCTVMRAKMHPMLGTWGMRMENLPGANWIHLDNKKPGIDQPRFFMP